MEQQNNGNQTLNKMMNSVPSNKPQNKPQKKGMVLDSTIQRLFSDLNNLTRRVRILEERFFEQRKKLTVIEENSVDGDKELEIKNKALFEEVSSLKKTVSEMREKMNIMIKELQASAKLTDLKVLEKYISMWEPLNYVTFEEMDKNIGHLIDLKMNELNLKIQQENFIRKEIKRQLEQLKKEGMITFENKDNKETFDEKTSEDKTEDEYEDIRELKIDDRKKNTDETIKNTEDTKNSKDAEKINQIIAKKNNVNNIDALVEEHSQDVSEN